MIFDGLFAAPRHDDDLVAARRQRLFHAVLNDGLVDDRQHLFRLRLGGRKETRAEAGRRENRFTHSHGHGFLSIAVSVREQMLPETTMGSTGLVRQKKRPNTIAGVATIREAPISSRAPAEILYKARASWPGKSRRRTAVASSYSTENKARWAHDSYLPIAGRDVTGAVDFDHAIAVGIGNQRVSIPEPLAKAAPFRRFVLFGASARSFPCSGPPQ